MRKTIPFTLLLLLVTPGWQTAFADEDPKWICIAEAATGFKYEGGKWVTVYFDVEPSRYLVSKKPWLGDMRYQVVRLGEKYGSACQENGPNKEGWLQCRGLKEFMINIKALRYLKSYLYGFADGTDNDENTPHIERGNCSPL